MKRDTTNTNVNIYNLNRDCWWHTDKLYRYKVKQEYSIFPEDLYQTFLSNPFINMVAIKTDETDVKKVMETIFEKVDALCKEYICLEVENLFYVNGYIEHEGEGLTIVLAFEAKRRHRHANV